TARLHLPQTVQRKDDVEVALRRRAVEADADVALEDIALTRVRGDGAEGRVAVLKGRVAAEVKAGGADQRQARLAERPAGRRPGSPLAHLNGEREQRVARRFGQSLESWHEPTSVLNSGLGTARPSYRVAGGEGVTAITDGAYRDA